jgi:hypothetical protein
MVKCLSICLLLISFNIFSQGISTPIDSSNISLPAVSTDASITYEQQLNFLKSVTSPSPTASSLGEYALNTPNLFTGILPISMPIYELSGRGISIPVTLNYMAKGNKVGEIASWVGLGWSLNAGGLITRTIRGLPDEETSGYLEKRKLFTKPDDLTAGLLGDNNNKDALKALYLEAANGSVDLTPDLFMLNALGVTYSFFSLPN